MTFTEWAIHHGKIFGLLTDQEADMIGEWAGMIEDSGYAADECAVVSRWLAVNEPPKFRGDHFPAIIRRLGQNRLAAQLAQRERDAAIDEANNPTTSCALCFGVGRAVVPHIFCVADGIWHHPFYELAVICRCARGKLIELNEPARIEQRFKKDGPQAVKQKPAMTIGQYEAKNPDWRDQVKARRLQFEHERAARAKAGPLDAEFGEIIDRAKR